MSSLSLLLILSLCTVQEEPAPDDTGRTCFDLRVSPIVDLYMLVRKHAEPDRGFTKVEGQVDQPAPDWPGFEEAVAAAKAIGAGFRSTLSWGSFDANLEGCETGADLIQVFGQLPETLPRGGGPYREPALELARKVAALEDVFLETRWPENKAALDRLVTAASERLLPRQEECFQYVLESFGMRDPEQPMLVYLTAESPPPGGVTYRRHGGGGISFVEVRDVAEDEVFEILLHETMHTLDILTRDQPTMLVRLEDGLREAGVSPRDLRMRNGPHLLMFVQAEETIRRFVNPDHVAYGELTGLYRVMGQTAEVVVPLWREMLELDLTPDEALDEMVAGLTDR